MDTNLLEGTDWLPGEPIRAEPQAVLLAVLHYSPFCFAMMVLATFAGTSAYVENTIE